MKIVKVKDFSKFPGPRYINLGAFSGEAFRDQILIPALLDYDEVSVDFNGVYGFGSSFLEESFGGLVRKGVPVEKIKRLKNNLVGDDSTIISEVISYIDDALKGSNNG